MTQIQAFLHSQQEIQKGKKSRLNIHFLDLINFFKRVKLWMKATGQEDRIKKRMKNFICGNHFHASMFWNSNRRRLKETAVPSSTEIFHFKRRGGEIGMKIFLKKSTDPKFVNFSLQLVTMQLS